MFCSSFVFDVCCLLCAVCCVTFDGRWLLCVACRLLFIACWLLYVVYCAVVVV